MQVSIDKAGRMVLPKPVRERLGLVRGGKLHLQESAEGVVLKPAENRTSLVRRPNGRLMITGLAASGGDWDRLVDDVREERIRETAGRRMSTSIPTSSSPTPSRTMSTTQML